MAAQQDDKYSEDTDLIIEESRKWYIRFFVRRMLLQWYGEVQPAQHGISL